MAQQTGARPSFLVLSFLTLTSSAWADERAQIDEKLQAFDQNPAAFVKDIKNVEKFDADTLVPASDLRSVSKIQRDTGRKALMRSRSRAYSSMFTNDDPRNLVDQFELTTLADMQNRQLMSARLQETPWSDDYWPYYAGTLASRYADDKFPASEDWSVNANYILSTDARHLQSVNRLSPAEKYDLLVGDANRTLTKTMLLDGQAHFNATGKVDTWMGICSGWAPASYAIDRPTKPVDLLAADGQTLIRFYPADIKALASLLWDRASGPIRLIGGRCQTEKPSVNSNNRVIAGECLDTNPGAWHLSIVNQIGVAKRSFIMDTTYDAEVWNQPVYGYRYSYFNPKTRRSVNTLQESYVDMNNFENDAFKAYRSKRAAFVSGIVMDVGYVAETKPVQAALDSAKDDRHVVIRYFYDLELDKQGNIVGGEWYQQAHPDFLWTTQQGAKANSLGDAYLNKLERRETWDTRETLPQSWIAAAQYASRSAQPLARIVESMVELSNQ